MKKIFIHFGCHKTGTTSIQKFFIENTDRLNKVDFDYMHKPNGRHTELGQCVLRNKVINATTPVPKRHELRKKTQNEISHFLTNSKHSNFIFSDEGLDFIRMQAEIDQLIKLFPENYKLIPLLCIREKEDWKKS